MRKYTYLLITALLLALFVLPVSAERTLPLLIDDAGLLGSDEYDKLLSMLEDISERQLTEVAVVTVDSLDGKSAQTYADDFYDNNGYGYGEDDDGVLLLISMGEREWHITTHGFAVQALTDYGLYLIEEEMLGDLSAGDYYDAFSAFAELCDEYLTLAREGTPVDYNGGNSYDDGYYYDDYYYESSFSPVSLIFPSLIIGFVIALIVVSVMKSGMTSVKMAKNAASYVAKGSLALTSQGDHFLYRNVTRTRRANNNSGGRSGGGSHTHRSSSGRSHGGRGGRF